MRTLILCGDKYHRAADVRRGLAWLEKAGVNPDWLENARDWDAEELDAYPLVVLAKSNHLSAEDEKQWMTEDIQAAIGNFVRSGGGLLAIHSGIAGYEACSLLRRILGGVFTHHPPQCPVTIAPQPGHPLTAGSWPFTLPDEHYFVTIDDAQVDVFLTATSEHGQQAAGWRRAEGKGRVGVLTPGHNVAVWQHESYQKLVSNLFHWCAQGL